MNKIIILVGLIVLQGCSSIPLSTMWKMKGFDKNDFTNIPAQHLKVKLRINKEVNIDDDSLTLNFAFKGDNENIDEELGLKLLSNSSKIIDKWFSKNEMEYAYEFRLNEDSMQAFKRIQASSIANRIHSKEKGGEFSFSAGWKFGDNSPEVYKFGIDLQLDHQEGYFTLFEGVEIDTSKSEQTL